MAKRWVAVEEHDGNECEPCDAIDGTLYTNRADAYADYPDGVGYKDCVGAQFGNACRGRVQKRRGASNEAAGMTDTRILAEFRNRLAERDALLPRAAKETDLRPAPAGKDWCKIENLSAAEASIHIFDEIGFYGTTAQSFVDQLNAITAPKITVYLNSPGGEVFDGIAIHTALAMSKAHVTTFVTGVAASAASFIAMAGDTIKMARNATMMIHDASGLAWGNAATMRAEADLLDKLSDNIADMYAMQAGGTPEDWRAAMQRETWYTGKEALAAGLVDVITDADEEPDEPDDTATAPAANRLSLAAFNYAGRSQAPAPMTRPDSMNHRVEFSIEPDKISAPASVPSRGGAAEPERDQARHEQADLMLALLAERMKHAPMKGAGA